MTKNVLIVEDDAFIMGTVARKFTHNGFTIAVATSSEEVEASLAKTLPDIVLLDILLPGVNGLDILKRLKSDEKTKSIPVVIFSNLGSTQDIKHAMDLGAIDYLVKANISPGEVVNKVTNILAK